MFAALAGVQDDEGDRSDDQPEHEPSRRRAIHRDGTQAACEPESGAEDQPQSEEHASRVEAPSAPRNELGKGESPSQGLSTSRRTTLAERE